jgi:F-type H+-transporting ATPase subunit gamma
MQQGGDEGAGERARSTKRQGVDYLFEPDARTILETLVPRFLTYQVWRVLLESNAAEQGARMVAMDNATTNADELLRNLRLQYNRARQSAITKEILEIISGANALESAKS